MTEDRKLEGQRVQYDGRIREWALQPGMQGNVVGSGKRYVLVQWDAFTSGPMAMSWEEVAEVR